MFMTPAAHPSHRTARTRLVRRVAAPVAVLGLGLGLVACGDDDESPATTDAPPVDTGGADATDDPTTDPDTTDDTTTDDTMTDPPVEDDFDEASIIGLPEDEAREVVESDGREFRVAVIDGEEQVLTMDYVEGRVNVDVLDGIVEAVEFYG